MGRRAAVLLLLLPLLAGGCVRISFNRCTEPEPPEECELLDAGPVDGGPGEDAGRESVDGGRDGS